MTKTSEFTLTDDEKRQVLSQRLKNLEAQRYDTEVSLRLLSGLPTDESVDTATAQAETQLKAIDAGVIGLMTIYDELTGATETETSPTQD